MDIRHIVFLCKQHLGFNLKNSRPKELFFSTLSIIELLRNWDYFGFSQLIPGQNKLLQLKLRGIALINGKYIKHIGYAIVNNSAHSVAMTVKVCTLGIAGENPHLPSSG